MSSAFGQVQDRALVRPMYEAVPPTLIAPTTKEIPYDYVATFTVKGERGNRVQDVINISTDGAFVAVSIGYSFIPAQLDPSTQPRDGLDGIARLAVTAAPSVEQRAVVQCLLSRLCGINFKYSIIDSGSGRELQNKAIHNIAGLGESNGNRPFRPLAKPMLFMPRSTIRVEVEEVSVGPLYGYDDASGRRVGAELYIVLHGYKILGYGTGQP